MSDRNSYPSGRLRELFYHPNEGSVLSQKKTTEPRVRRFWQKGKASFSLKVLLSSILLGVVLYVVDYREVLHIVASSKPWYLLAFAVVFYMDRALMAYKWRPLLWVVNVAVNYLVLLQLSFVAPLIGTVLPATVGGDAFRVYRVTKLGFSARDVISSIIMERLIGLAALLLLVGISVGLALYLFDGSLAYIGAPGWLLLALVALTVPIFLVVWILRTSWAKRVFCKFSRYTVINWLWELYIRLGYFRHHHRIIIFVFGLTFLEQLIPIAGDYILIKALHIDVSFIVVVAIVPIIVLTSRLPISFEGIGLQEGLYIGLLSLVGVTPSEALVLSSANRIMGILCMLPWGAHYLFSNRKTSPLKPDVYRGVTT
jgi:uncharacterized protein (TIRG00374 family)